MPARPPVRVANLLGGTIRPSTYSRGSISQLTSPIASTISATNPPPLLQPISRQTQTPRFAPFSSSSETAHRAMEPQDQKTIGGLERNFTPALFKSLRDFWFEHFESEDDHLVPKPNHNMRWFMGGKSLDDFCLERFAPTLEAIRKSGATTGDEILKAAQPSGPLDWLSLILLFDQVTRNCYRGEQASIVFNLFDPMAQQIALKAIDQGIPDKNPEIRWHFAYRNWFYMPLMHSESAAIHEKAVEKFGLYLKDIQYLAVSQDNPDSEELEKSARKVVQRDVDAAKKVGNSNLEFEKKHQVLIQQFGRYPHRNQALGRESTPAEKEYLENGGESFSA